MTTSFRQPMCLLTGWPSRHTFGKGIIAVTTRTVRFVLDFTPPVLSVTGVSDGEFSAAAVQLFFGADDATQVVTQGLLDGAPIQSGAIISGEGDHVLTLRAEDAAGNVAEKVVRFTLDFTPPTVEVSGVTPGAWISGPVQLVVQAADLHLETVSSTLDGQPYLSGTQVSAEGPHTLVVEAVDRAGQVTRQSVSFEIDTTPPSIDLAGVKEGAYLSGQVVPVFSARDEGLVSVEALLDGFDFLSGTPVTAEGPHTLMVLAKDRAGNESRAGARFVIDSTAPTVVLEGVTDGQISDELTPTFSVSDVNLKAAEATLDGEPFVSGTRIAQPGTYSLSVRGVDLAGNEASLQARFTIVSMRPVFSYAACAVGSLRVSNLSQVAGSVGANGNVTLEHSATVRDQVVAGADVTLAHQAQVGGSVFYGANFSAAAGAKLGGQERLSPHPSPCGCGFDTGQRLALAAARNNNATLALVAPPDAWIEGALVLKGAKLTLPAGRYYLNRLEVTNGAVLTV